MHIIALFGTACWAYIIALLAVAVFKDAQRLMRRR